VSKITNIQRGGKVDYYSEHNKNIAGFEINVPFNDSEIVTVEYTVPITDNYTLYVQKQPGIKDLGLELNYDYFSYSDQIKRDAFIQK